MTREEAIETLGRVVPFATQNGEKIAEAIDMAIEALSERPKGEWVFHVNFSDESQRDDYDLICTNCGELYRCDCQDDVNDFVWNAHYCMNCGAYMGGDNGTQKHL